MIAPYFLTESVSLETQQLIQRGIRLDKDHKEFVYEGPYTQEKHLAWIEQRRRRAQYVDYFLLYRHI